MNQPIDNSTDIGLVIAIISALWLFAFGHYICGVINTLVLVWIA